jgi:hypothetical protein
MSRRSRIVGCPENFVRGIVNAKPSTALRVASNPSGTFFSASCQLNFFALLNRPHQALKRLGKSSLKELLKVLRLSRRKANRRVQRRRHDLFCAYRHNTRATPTSIESWYDEGRTITLPDCLAKV